MTGGGAAAARRWTAVLLTHVKVFLVAAVCGLAAYGVVYLLVRLERIVLG